MQREKIKPIVDVPLVLQMETVAGTEATSAYNGIEYRYNVLVDSRPAIIYLPREGRDAIVRSQAAPGDYVELLKQKRGPQISFQAQVLGEEYGERPRVNASRALAPVRPLPPAAASHRPAPPQYPTQWQDEPPATAPAPARPQPPQAQRPPVAVHPYTDQVAACLKTAFDAWEQLVAHAGERGVKIEYTSEDIRATGTSIFIQRSGGGR